MKQVLRRVPGVASTYRRRQRRRMALSYYAPKLRSIEEWLRSSRESTNFTYELTDLNTRHLGGFVAVITGIERSLAGEYLQEILTDRALADHIAALSRDVQSADPAARYGRRAGWYAIVRALKPRIVVETGVEKGLGACVISSALLRNREEGHEGRYFGTDIDRHAGWLYSGRYAEVGEVLYGDSLESIHDRIPGPVDVFINDSDHSRAYEAAEYRAIAPKLAPGAVILGDNAHVSPELLEFADDTARQFLFFREEPAGHWYPGAGIGAAW